jgi:hypothetical protein
VARPESCSEHFSKARSIDQSRRCLTLPPSWDHVVWAKVPNRLGSQLQEQHDAAGSRCHPAVSDVSSDGFNRYACRINSALHRYRHPTGRLADYLVYEDNPARHRGSSAGRRVQMAPNLLAHYDPLCLPAGSLLRPFFISIFAWHEPLLPLFLTNRFAKTFPAVLTSFQGQTQIAWELMCARATIQVLPIITDFLRSKVYCLRIDTWRA